MKYTVKFLGRDWGTITETVDADSPKEAERIALEPYVTKYGLAFVSTVFSVLTDKETQAGLKAEAATDYGPDETEEEDDNS